MGRRGKGKEKGRESEGGKGREGRRGKGREIEFPYLFNPTLTTGSLDVMLLNDNVYLQDKTSSLPASHD